MRFEAYTPKWQVEVAALADLVFGEGYFAERSNIAGAPGTCISLCIGDDGQLAGFARGRVLPQGGFGDFLEHRVEDVPEDLSHDLNQILEYVDTLASLQVPEGERLELGPSQAPEREASQIPPDPMAHPPTDSAPDFRDGFFVVPSPPSLGGADDPEGSP